MKPPFGPDLSVPPEASLRRDLAAWLRRRAFASRTACEVGASRALRGIPEADPDRLAWFAREAEVAAAWAAKLEAPTGTLRDLGKSCGAAGGEDRA